MAGDAALALQAALIGALRGDAALAALLGGERVYDAAPRGMAPPYVVLAGLETRDFGTKTESGAEHLVTLHAWSGHEGRKEAHEIGAAIEAALAAPLMLAGHALVNLRVVSWAAAREAGGHYRGVLRMRAVTEPT